jgi:hypothetical protein
MPLPGGPSDKFGNRYELWWTVSQLVRMLHGQEESIRIEDPGVTKAEFVITSGGRRELHQAKRSHPDGKWSIASLAASDVKVLQAIFAELAGNDEKFVFVSSSDARELSELAERARDAVSVQEFETQFLNAKEQKANFDKLRKHWNNAPIATAYDILRRVEVRTSDERSLEEKVNWGLSSLFLSDPDSVCAELRRIAEDSVHQIITRDVLVALLDERGFKLRRLAKPNAAPALVSEVTDRYLAEARRKLIRKSLIHRATSDILLSQIAGPPFEVDCAITGKAGSGKTACVVEIVETLRARGIPVLAFRLDRLEPVSTPTALGEKLGMEESPALVLAAAATGREAVLIVDQLDAVSTTSGRISDFLDAVEGLLVEARGLRATLKLHIIVVCRAFDWQNDHRLRRMLSEKHTNVEVSEFSIDEVKAVLSAEHFSSELFQSRQLELLRLPQNLALFLDAGFDPAEAAKFNTAKELFDRYWDAKRRAVTERVRPQGDQWLDVIQLLCEEMTRVQQLFVPREKLDRFASDYVRQMASEGVLTFDGKRYGFGHESFFDYCFARVFIVKDQPLTEFLTTSEEHLFRRAQVRQVLAYLRDADRQRYCAELHALLTDERVRTHIKDIAVALVANLPDPGDDEWVVLEAWLNSEVAAFARGQRNQEKFATLVWQHFFTSPSWFCLADKRGLVASWLASDNDNLIDMAVNYLKVHQRHSGDRVAELLEPYVGKGGKWKNRLRFVVEWANHENSRAFFELFLCLIDDGTLDDARGPIASNSTFWSMLYGLAKARPEWVPEVISRWLRRRLLLIHERSAGDADVNWGDLFKHDDFGPEHFYDSAGKAAEVFVRHVLPVILEISDAAVYKDKVKPPKRDAVWPLLFHREYESIDSACLNSLVIALNKLAKEDPDKLRGTTPELRRRDTFTANFLLLSLYTEGATHFADEAVALIYNEAWRFDCGFSDSSYWVATELIRAVVPVCSAENRLKFEDAILRYSTEYERTRPGRKWAGRASFVLLCAIPPEYRSQKGKSRFQQLERKFEKADEPPRGIKGGWVGSPIVKKAADKMTDEQWLKAIAKYRFEDNPNRWDDPEKGGAPELAGMLRDFVRNEPERFACLSLRFPVNANPVYIERTLEGLKGTPISVELKLAVCRKAYTESRGECGTSIADLLGSIEEALPDDAVRMLDWLATEHPDPERELWSTVAWDDKAYYGGNIHNHGINTTRGRAAEAIRNLVLRDARYITRFRSTLGDIVSDQSLSVRSCVASTLLAVARDDLPLALQLFQKLTATDERLLQTPYVERFIYYNLREHFEELRPIVERILRSTIPDVSRAGARLASLAALHHESAANLVEEAISGTPAQRCGVAEVAASNIAHAECRAWCESHLLQFFNDTDAEVRRQAASCFRRLEREPLEAYENLITAFSQSAAYQDDSFSILHVLDESLERLPGITSLVCEKFLDRFTDEARDIRTHRAGDVHIVTKLILRTYQHHRDDDWASRCLNLIDRMCLEGIREVKGGLEEFER